MSVTEDFYVTLVSDESNDYFDVGFDIAEFTNKLPFPLNLKERYKVALTEIFVPPFFLQSDEEDSNEVKRMKRADVNQKPTEPKDLDIYFIYLFQKKGCHVLKD